MTGKKEKFVLPALMGLVLLTGMVLRGIYLTADPPADLSISGGLVGDAGQHAYGARNRVLFDRWGFDDWHPYIAAPFIDVLINYPVYKWLGINFYSHKLIPLFFSSLALLLFSFLVYRRLGVRAALLASIFLSFNYPVIIYSKAANRYFPMIFFFGVALYFFIRGADRQRGRFFGLSALFLVCAYLCQNHVLYLVSLFLVLGVLWLIEKKILFRHFALFWGSLLALLGAWYYWLFLPNRYFFDFFVGHNKLVRRISSPGQLFQNILDNPFLIQMRSDPAVLLIAALAILFYVFWKLAKKKDIPLLVEVCVFWLWIGAAFHSIWSYRPTRFYLILVFPAAILAGWILSHLLENRPKMGLGLPAAAAFLSLPVTLVFLGISRYGRFLKFKILENPLWMLLPVLFLVTLFLLLFLKKRNWISMALVGICFHFSIALNLESFSRWAAHREYKVVNTARVFGRVIPPSRVAGNWASLLSTGTLHRTHLLSGEMGVNWRKDFFKKYHIQYLLLTEGRFGSELREYKRFFREELAKAKLTALFRIYRTDVYLFALEGDRGNENRLEFETFSRDSERAMVIYDPHASAKMALRYKKNDAKPALSLTKRDLPLPAGNYDLEISAKGKFKGRIIFKQDNNTIKEGFLKFTGTGYETNRIDNIPLSRHLSITIKLSRIETDILLDCIDLEPQ